MRIPCYLLSIDYWVAMGLLMGGLYPQAVMASHLEEMRNAGEISQISDLSLVMGGLVVFVVVGSLIIIGLHYLNRER